MISKINRADLVRLMRSRTRAVKVADVRNVSDYRAEHIKDAVSVPVEDLEKYAGQRLDKDEHIVIYGGRTEYLAAAEAARKLAMMGYKHVYDYSGGFDDYKRAGLPTEGGKAKDAKDAEIS